MIRKLSENLSPHFKRNEFACKCGCGIAVVDKNLVTALEKLRVALDVPVLITSGYRCASHNKRVGGSSNSQHVRGKAVDIVVPGKKKSEVIATASQISEFKDGGIGAYVDHDHTHLDVRGTRARWGHDNGRFIDYGEALARLMKANE